MKLTNSTMPPMPTLRKSASGSVALLTLLALMLISSGCVRTESGGASKCAGARYIEMADSDFEPGRLSKQLVAQLRENNQWFAENCE